MSLRCFVALDVDATMRSACEEARIRLTESDARLTGEKWVAAENLHVTLCFVGDVATGRIEELIRRLTLVLDSAAPISLSRPRITAMPSADRASMIWVALDDHTGAFGAAAAALQADVKEFDSGCGAGNGRTDSHLPSRMPSPHLTLCRLRRKRNLESKALTSSQQAFRGLEHPMSYPRATLYSSRLAPQGPTYSELFVWHMRGE